MPPKVPRTNALYLSPRINQHLAGMLTHPLTVVEAPMGTGKSTAVREYLKSQRVHCMYLTLRNDSGFAFWNDVCQLLLEHFPQHRDIAQNLLSLGVPVDIVRIKEAIRQLNQFEIRQRTVLVLDDFHLVNIPVVNRFLEILIREAIENLHVVLLIDGAYRGNWRSLRSEGILHMITRKDLELNRQEVSEYFSQCGVETAKSSLDVIYQYTEGWFGAVFLCLLCCSKGQSITYGQHINDLVRLAFFEGYSGEIRDFLLHLSMFESFSLAQAAFFWSQNNVKRVMRDLTAGNTLISFDEAYQRFRLHPILLNYLGTLFRELEPEQQRLMRMKCATWHLKAKEYWEAIEICYSIKDFPTALTALSQIKDIAAQAERWPRIRELISECPEELLEENIQLVFACALAAFNLNDIATFESLCRWLERCISALPQQTPKTKQLRGELEMLYIYGGFHNLEDLLDHLGRASSYLQEPNRMLACESPWSMGIPSMLLMFHCECGKLDDEVQLIKQSVPLYHELTHGQGAGIDVMLEAEVCLYRGDLSNAERLAARAELLAGRRNQTGSTISAMILKARIAVYQGHYSEAERLLQNMSKTISTQNAFELILTTELCRAWIYSVLGLYEQIPEWIREGRSGVSRFYQVTSGAFFVIHFRALLLGGDYNRLIDTLEPLLASEYEYCHIMLQIFGSIYLAGAYYRLGKYDTALKKLLFALDLAMPDRIYLPFVMNFETTRPLIDTLSGHTVYSGQFQIVQRMITQWQQTKKKILCGHFGMQNDYLTIRGEEIAYWAARGYSINSIADKLALSPSAVRYAIDVAYEKFGVQDRLSLFFHLSKR